MDFISTPDMSERKVKRTPLQHMLTVMNDPGASPDRRDRMAVAAAPYCHPKIIEAARGKKAEENKAALTAGVGTSWANDLDAIRAQ